ncbi:hypothetical protein HPP92_009802 [Vanilla planifolia]|uniref:Uncharacterized protein n=1 Tax=Vanilla planifolia TaxID=51239 RepID=A0A835RKL7_VANPL|nr:hypothetical protein HPP92_009802 [Vanilla planifolia]
MSDGRKISQVWSSFGGVQILVSFVLSSMVPPRSTSQVSLRGASAREISRNALLEKVVHERQLRNFTRRASAAAIFIQVLPFSHDFCFSHVVVTFGLFTLSVNGKGIEWIEAIDLKKTKELRGLEEWRGGGKVEEMALRDVIKSVVCDFGDIWGCWRWLQG